MALNRAVVERRVGIRTKEHEHREKIFILRACRFDKGGVRFFMSQKDKVVHYASKSVEGGPIQMRGSFMCLYRHVGGGGSLMLMCIYLERMWRMAGRYWFGAAEPRARQDS